MDVIVQNDRLTEELEQASDYLPTPKRRIASFYESGDEERATPSRPEPSAPVDLLAAYQSSSYCEETTRRIDGIAEESRNIPTGPRGGSIYAANPFVQIYVLAKRVILSTVRNPLTTYAQLMQVLFMALLVQWSARRSVGGGWVEYIVRIVTVIGICVAAKPGGFDLLANWRRSSEYPRSHWRVVLHGNEPGVRHARQPHDLPRGAQSHQSRACRWRIPHVVVLFRQDLRRGAVLLVVPAGVLVRRLLDGGFRSDSGGVWHLCRQPRVVCRRVGLDVLGDRSRVAQHHSGADSLARIDGAVLALWRILR